MSSLSRMTAALGVAHNENTLALANINFDFSLFRFDAPPAFRELGASISEQRRQDGEAGTPHRTARRLGALFEGVLPQSPDLARAYGERVSEIALFLKSRPRETNYGGPFAAHVGPDGTALWAAATSGPSAVPVVMLACMLARIWPGDEATSLWVELVNGRRKEIEADCDGSRTRDYVLLQAAQQDLSRSQLRQWDASARAWLRSADEVKRTQQTQLMLIIDNIGIPVNSNSNAYRSIVDSSQSALLFMDSLLRGVPQRVQSGAFLLGLSAWHLYPDMVIHSPVTKEIKQHDHLIPCGSIVTLGLQSQVHADQGVYWSLPLAHLRYYGDPIQSSRSTGIDGSRVSMDQLIYVAMGSILWTQRSSDVKPTIQWLYDLLSYFRLGLAKAVEENRTHDCIELRDFLDGQGWLQMLMYAAENFKHLNGQEKETANKLMALGHRRFCRFLAREKATPPPLFGLNDPSMLFSLLRSDQERINILRRLASKSQLPRDEVIIRYKPDGLSLKKDSINKPAGHPIYEFASAFPCERKSSKRATSGVRPQNRSHKRWIASTLPRSAALKSQAVSDIIALGEECIIKPIKEVDSVCKRTWIKPYIHSVKSNKKARQTYGPIYLQEAPWTAGNEKTDKPVDLKFVAGDLETAALFRVDSAKNDVPVENEIFLGEFTALLDTEALSVKRLLWYFTSLHTVQFSDSIVSLKALASAKNVYAHLSDATIALSVASEPLHNSLWILARIGQLQLNSWRLDLNLAETFACIAMFESGTNDIDPQSLSHVFAMSSDNSIFVAAPLLGDPGRLPEPHCVRRVIGNVGRPGIAMLIPPPKPLVLKPKIQSWQMINHASFDGVPADSFENTSLHLSFTQYSMPYDNGDRGTQDSEVNFLESLISIHDRDRWIADLDILGTLPRLVEFNPLESCDHPRHLPPDCDAVAIDNWDELLDREPVTAVIRAHKNPMARLATAVFSVNQGCPTVVVPNEVCWLCLTKHHPNLITYVQ